MQTLKELLLSQVLREKKDHLIKKLNMPEDKKAKIIAFFEKHPNLENKIDWNRKNLSWEDFEPLVNFRQEKAKHVEKSIDFGEFKENIDYQILHGNSKMNIIQPLTYEFEVWLQSNNELGPSTKWCIGYEKDSTLWDRYIDHSTFVCFWNTKRKIMAQINRDITFWNEQDVSFSYDELEDSLKNLIDMNDFNNFDLKMPEKSEKKRVPEKFVEWEDYIHDISRGINSFTPLSFEFLKWFASDNDFGVSVEWDIVYDPSEWNEDAKRNMLYIAIEENQMAHGYKELYEINFDDETIYTVYSDGTREPYTESYLDSNIKDLLDEIWNIYEDSEWEKGGIQPKLFKG